MKKKNLILATALPTFFGPFGLLYSSISAGVTMIIVNVVLALVLSSGGSTDSFIYFILLLQPLEIFWSVLIARIKNRAIDHKHNIPNDIEINIGGEAFMYALMVLFLTLGITAFVCQFHDINLLSTNIYTFYLLELLFSVALSVLVEAKYQENHVNEEEKDQTITENQAS